MTEKALAFARMVDSVAINPRDTFDDIKKLVEDAKKYHYHLIYGLSCYNEYMIEQLKGRQAALRLLPLCRGVLEKYDLTDDFADTPDYELFYKMCIRDR